MDLLPLGGEVIRLRQLQHQRSPVNNLPAQVGRGSVASNAVIISLSVFPSGRAVS